jgi:hypothetical protein
MQEADFQLTPSGWLTTTDGFITAVGEHCRDGLSLTVTKFHPTLPWPLRPSQHLACLICLQPLGSCVFRHAWNSDTDSRSL